MFKCKFHQQTKSLWKRIKFSKIDFVLLPWKNFLSTIIWVLNFVASSYQNVITNIWLVTVYFLFNICSPLSQSLGACPQKIIDACLLLKCFFLQASILDNILLIHTWKELIKEVNMCIVSILHVFNIYFQSRYQHIHDRDCLM